MGVIMRCDYHNEEFEPGARCRRCFRPGLWAKLMRWLIGAAE